MNTSQPKNSRWSWKTLLLLTISLILLNLLSQRFFVRLDLTQDQRYSIHPATKELLRKVAAEVKVTIYLAGDLPIEFKQLQHATKDLLTEFLVYSKHPISYQIVDINKAPIDQRNALLKNLATKGIQPTNLQTQEQGQRMEKLIYPGAILAYQGKEAGFMLLKSNNMASAKQMINQSIENLEYELTQALAKLINKKRASIAVIKGHGEPNEMRLHGFFSTMQEHYDLHKVDLAKDANLSQYSALCIIKPQQTFLETEKYILDQYIMQGGKVLFFLDRLHIDMEHLHSDRAFALPIDLNLDDQLFRYGIRINQDLVQDLHAGIYPFIVGKMGNQPQLRLLPWFYFPILANFPSHLITRNLNPLYTQFVSSLDTVQADGVTKTPLAFTSNYSRRLGMPVQVDLASLGKEPEVALYNQGPIPVIYLLEGRFKSLYKNRLPPIGFDVAEFMPISQPTKILVAASGSIVLNALEPRQGRPLHWGYDPFLQQTFANEDFVLNTLAYMLAEDGLINTKHKVIRLCYLDANRLEQNKLAWQLLNISMPILLLLLIGIVWNWRYKRTYKRP